MNRIMGISLGVMDIEDAYDLCKSTNVNSYYLQLRVGRASFVIALDDSNRYAGDNRVFVRRGWKFGETEAGTTVRIPRKMGTPQSKC